MKACFGCIDFSTLDLRVVEGFDPNMKMAYFSGFPEKFGRFPSVLAVAVPMPLFFGCF